MRRSIASLALAALAVSCTPPEPPPPMGMLIDQSGDVGAARATLTAAQRRVRAGEIRDAAFAAGMTQGWLLAGIADAETRMSHCWSELTWACKGPNSSDCGGGPVVAGAGDGPCYLRQGGIGMFQFDAGTFDDTLRREGNRILSIAGNTQAAVDFTASMVVRSAYVSGVSTRAQAIAWMNGVRIGNGRWVPWIKTVTHYYNGCAPSYSCWSQRYAHYRDNTSGVYNEMGADFWVPCSAETCNGRDDDCDEQVDEGDVCENSLLVDQPVAYAPPAFTDVDGDGRADLCARGYGGVRCWTASATGWTSFGEIGWGDESGWDDVTNYATLRMGDLNGDRRADVCARANAGVYCALSNGAGFEPASVWREGLSDDAGWDAAKFYTTLRLADVDGDGKDDLCARDSEGFGCWISDGARFDRRVEGPEWSDALGWGRAKHYGTIRMGDLNGDRRADVCARAIAGVRCALSDGAGFPTAIEGPAWTDDAGWDQMRSWSTIRLVDFDADGLADLCGRSPTDLRCVRSIDGGFGEPVIVAELSDDSGWGDISNYATLRTGDINGDGAVDLCARANAGVYCWAWNGAEFTRVTGPEWSDEGSWDNARYYETIRLADFDGDGLEDVCGRAGAGWRCHPSMGDSFGDAVTFDELTNDGGWTAHRYWSTIMSGGHACRPEMEACNGLDDDCDGMVDEHAVAEICNGVDDDCDGAADEGLSCEVVPGSDGGVVVPPGADGGVTPPGTGPAAGLHGGCAVSAGRSTPFALLVLGAALFCLLRRRR